MASRTEALLSKEAAQPPEAYGHRVVLSYQLHLRESTGVVLPAGA
jgi:hypothetical protein